MIISRAPLRVSFFGGGTDYPEHFASEGGAVLGTAIDKSIYITANRFHSELFDYSIRVAYRKVELVQSVDQIEHAPFRETLKRCGIARDIELNHIADLPAFTGLGSSSSFTVALLQALHAYCGRYRSGIDLAYEAIHLERHVFRDSVGCQDQVFAAVGGFNLIEFRAEDDIQVYRVPISPQRLSQLRDHLMICFTGIRRSASEVAAKQIRKISHNRSALLRIRRLVDEACNVLVSDRNLSRFGELLHESWMCKRSLHEEVSSGAIDQLYDRAMSAGALGGKLLGAGNGGFLLLFVPPEKKSRVRQALGNPVELKIGLGAPGCQIIHGQYDAPVRDSTGHFLAAAGA